MDISKRAEVCIGRCKDDPQLPTCLPQFLGSLLHLLINIEPDRCFVTRLTLQLAGGILRNVKSVGLAMLYWPIGLIIAISGFVTFLELSSYFPSRSGKEVVYLEQAYPRPKYFFPTAFAMLNVLLAFSSSNAITLSNYLFRIVGRSASEWESKGVAVAGYTLAVFFCIASNKWSLQFSNAVGVVKVGTLVL